jgi:hypothetical protein
MKRSEVLHLGFRLGSSEAKKATVAIGPTMTWSAAYDWLNRAIEAAAVGRNYEDGEAWEWGCRIMFMLKIRRHLV